jgi:hypothetical protein
MRGGRCSDVRAIELGYEAMGEGLAAPLGLCLVLFPSIPADLLSNWQTLEYWLSDIHPGLSVECVWEPSFDYSAEDAPKPSLIFGDALALKNAVLDFIRSGEAGGMFESVWGATVTDGTRSLELVFHDMDAWSLGYADSVSIFERLEDLTESRGYFQV